MKTGEDTPQIALEYLLRGDDVQHTTAFQEAGSAYVASRARYEDEEAYTRVNKDHENFAVIEIGRNVVEKYSRAEIGNEADEMHKVVAGHLGKVGLESIEIRSLIGVGPRGALPDPE